MSTKLFGLCKECIPPGKHEYCTYGHAMFPKPTPRQCEWCGKDFVGECVRLPIEAKPSAHATEEQK